MIKLFISKWLTNSGDNFVSLLLVNLIIKFILKGWFKDIRDMSNRKKNNWINQVYWKIKVIKKEKKLLLLNWNNKNKEKSQFKWPTRPHQINLKKHQQK